MSSPWAEIEAARRRRERLTVLLGLLVAVGALAGLRYFAERESPTEAPAAASGPLTQPPGVAYRLEETVPVGDAQPPDVVVPADDVGPGAVGVYECTVNGQRVLSDQPCGPDARVRVLEVDRPDPREVARLQQQTWAAQSGATPAASVPMPQSSRRSGGAETMAANDGICRAIDQAIANLNARMRQGYTSQEGERLRAEWHRLQEQRADYDCGRNQ